MNDHINGIAYITQSLVVIPLADRDRGAVEIEINIATNDIVMGLPINSIMFVDDHLEKALHNAIRSRSS
jgi:hypothetical protein